MDKTTAERDTLVNNTLIALGKRLGVESYAPVPAEDIREVLENLYEIAQNEARAHNQIENSAAYQRGKEDGKVTATADAYERGKADGIAYSKASFAGQVRAPYERGVEDGKYALTASVYHKGYREGYADGRKQSFDEDAEQAADAKGYNRGYGDAMRKARAKLSALLDD